MGGGSAARAGAAAAGVPAHFLPPAPTRAEASACDSAIAFLPDAKAEASAEAEANEEGVTMGTGLTIGTLMIGTCGRMPGGAARLG